MECLKIHVPKRELIDEYGNPYFICERDYTFNNEYSMAEAQEAISVMIHADRMRSVKGEASEVWCDSPEVRRIEAQMKVIKHFYSELRFFDGMVKNE